MEQIKDSGSSQNVEVVPSGTRSCVDEQSLEAVRRTVHTCRLRYLDVSTSSTLWIPFASGVVQSKCTCFDLGLL